MDKKREGTMGSSSKEEQMKKIALKGDPTNTGGAIITGDETFKYDGKAVAELGDTAASD